MLYEFEIKEIWLLFLFPYFLDKNSFWALCNMNKARAVFYNIAYNILCRMPICITGSIGCRENKDIFAVIEEIKIKRDGASMMRDLYCSYKIPIFFENILYIR